MAQWLIFLSCENKTISLLPGTTHICLTLAVVLFENPCSIATKGWNVWGTDKSVNSIKTVCDSWKNLPLKNALEPWLGSVTLGKHYNHNVNKHRSLINEVSSKNYSWVCKNHNHDGWCVWPLVTATKEGQEQRVNFYFYVGIFLN